MPTHSAPPGPKKPVELDEAFLRRVHQANVGLTLLFGLLLLFSVDPGWAAGFTAFGLWSAANLWVLERLLRAAIRPGDRDPVTIAVVAVVKLPILYGGLVALLALGDFPPFSIVAGLSVPLVVIFLKALGHVVARPTTASTSPSSSDSRS
jgi:hypothetical protein